MWNQMRTSDFDFDLPSELIAQTPTPRRDESRLLVLHRDSGKIEHRRFRDLLDYLRGGDVLALNNSRVIPARLRGVNVHTGGQFEVLLLEENARNDWWVMLRPGRRARAGTQMVLRYPHGKASAIRATLLDKNHQGHCRLRFSGAPNITDLLELLGEVPLPPYIRRADDHQRQQDRQRYQTVFAQPPGSVAAPTAGLHFTESLLDEIRSAGVQVCFITLHVGLGTFAPVKTETIAAHPMQAERYELSEESARKINQAKRTGRPVIAVGTTTMRLLESLAESSPAPLFLPASACSSQLRPSLLRPPHLPHIPERAGCEKAPAHRPELRSQRSQSGESLHSPAAPLFLPASTCSSQLSPSPPQTPSPATPARKSGVLAGSGKTQIFIYPPYHFKIADALLTNFHLPRSTLLMLVSAFAAPNETRGRDLILTAYAEAIRQGYRFFSYGDAMLIL